MLKNIRDTVCIKSGIKKNIPHVFILYFYVTAISLGYEVAPVVKIIRRRRTCSQS